MYVAIHIFHEFVNVRDKFKFYENIFLSIIGEFSLILFLFLFAFTYLCTITILWNIASDILLDVYFRDLCSEEKVKWKY